MLFSDALILLLGATLDSTLSFDKHVNNVVRACTFHTRASRHIRPLLDHRSCQNSDCVNPCNNLLCGTTERNFGNLKWIQNILASVVLQASWLDSANGLLQELHWLPIRQRVQFAAITRQNTLVWRRTCQMTCMTTYQQERFGHLQHS